MYKKLLISLGILVATVFSINVCFANDNGMNNGAKDAVNGIRNVVGGAENAVENAAKDISNTSKDATKNMENGANDATNNGNNNNSSDNRNTIGTTTNNDGGYSATRTATDTTTGGTLMGMNATAWTWLIMGIAAIAIVALVWYYGTQMRSSNYDDKD